MDFIPLKPLPRDFMRACVMRLREHRAATYAQPTNYCRPFMSETWAPIPALSFVDFRIS